MTPITGGTRPLRACRHTAGGRGAVRILGLLVAMVGMSACGVTNILSDDEPEQAIPPAELASFPSVVEAVEVWETDAGGAGEHFLRLTPAADETRAYVASYDGKLTAFDLGSGREIWQRSLNEPITGSPGVGDGIVAVGTKEANVFAFNADDGAALWRARVSSEVLAGTTVAEGTVTARTGDGKLFALDAGDGRRRWVFDREVPLLTLRGASTPVIDDGVVYAGFDSGRLIALKLESGETLWEFRIAIPSGRSELERIVDIDSDIVLSDDVLYGASYQGKVGAVSATLGQIDWTRDISSHAGLAIDESRVFVVDEQDHVWALERDTGNSVWKQEGLSARQLSPPALWNGLVVVGDYAGYVHFLDPVTGSFVARTRVGDERIIVPPISTDAGVLIYTSEGDLALLTLRTR